MTFIEFGTVETILWGITLGETHENWIKVPVTKFHKTPTLLKLSVETSSFFSMRDERVTQNWAGPIIIINLLTKKSCCDYNET